MREQLAKLAASESDALRRANATALLSVSRQTPLASSCAALASFSPAQLRAHLEVRFSDERAVGAGVLREWLTLLAAELFDARNALFCVADDGVRLQPSPASFANPDCLEYFSFAGRVVALAIAHDELLGVRFTAPFYKQLVGIEARADVDEITSIDADVARNLQWLLDTSIDELDLELTFALDADVFGKLERVELIPNGAHVPVTDANKRDYVRLVVELRTTGIYSCCFSID